mmetsp:Transcript_72371/g.209558  ORF Transcript_72371/g.209558 Transcript_72371/m.209558 type:complete len:249 (+) Transcript_72371:104-850(+)
MPPTPAKMKSKSAKKRQRDEVDASASDTDASETKRQNTSKTPVRAKKGKKETEAAESVRKTAQMASISEEIPLQPPSSRSDKALLTQNDQGNSGDLLAPPPPVDIQEAEDRNGAATRSSKKKELKKADAAQGKSNTSSESPVEATLEAILPDEAAKSKKQKRGKWSLLLVSAILIFVTMTFSYGYISATLTVNELKHDLQNCIALQSPQKMQDETYIKELEDQLRLLKQETKARDVELRALQEECHGT